MSWWHRKSREYRARPIPELLDGEDWEVRNSGKKNLGYVDFDNKEFVVPFEETPCGELVRAHEAMHVKITPRNFSLDPEMDWVTLQSLEDCRVWQGLRSCGIKTYNEKARLYTDKQLETSFKTSPHMQHPLKHAEACFATRGMAEERICREMSDPKAVEIVDELYEKYFAEYDGNGFPSFEEAMACATELRERIIEAFPENPPPPPMGCPNKGKKGEEGDQNGNLTYSWEPGKGPEENQDGIGALTQEELEEAHGAGIENTRPMSSFSYPDDFDNPGELKIEYPKLDHAIKFKLTDGVKMTPSDEGVIPIRMHRYATDMKLFSRKGKRRTGAAVLIDVSGSMSLQNDMILDIIKQCPASIIGIYSGQRIDGTLRIIAENGRYSTALKNGMGGANVVDI